MDRDAAALSEFLEAGARERRTFSLTVTTDEGMGRIYVSVGEIVHATYGHLSGDAAVFAMTNAAGVEFEATSEKLRPPSLPVSKRPVALLPPALPAPGAPARTAHVTVARLRTTPPSSHVSIAPWAVSSPAAGPLVTPRARQLKLFAVVACVVGGGAALGLGAGYARNELPFGASGAPFAKPAAAAERAAAGSTKLAAVASAPTAATSAALAPSSGAARDAEAPTILVKLLIGTDGRPRAARVAGSNLDAAHFERAALAAAQQLEFRPALRDGLPVEAEVEWPVTFNAEPFPAPAPVSAPR
jgi:TonB family protein